MEAASSLTLAIDEPTATRRKYHRRKHEPREPYGYGSCSPCMVPVRDGCGKVVFDIDGTVLKEQERDRSGRPVWLVCVSLGVEVIVGDDGRAWRRQRKVQRRVHGTIGEAREMLRKLREGCPGGGVAPVEVTFGEACEAWLGSMREANICSAAKLRDYTTALKRATQRMGRARISSISCRDVEDMLAAVRAAEGMSVHGSRLLVQLVKRVFSYCIDRGWISDDPCRRLRTPRVTKTPDRRSLTPTECERLRACLDRDGREAREAVAARGVRRLRQGQATEALGLSALSGLAAVRLMLATGMRRGEALGLAWDDVDLDARQVTVRRSFNAQKELKGPKTRSGVRTISLDADTADFIAALKETQAAALALVVSPDMPEGVAQTGETPVCCNGLGGMLDPSSCSQWWRAYRDEIGFPGLRMHELRHTQATMLLAHGIGVKDVQGRLGHASAAMTLDVYGHAVPANDRAAADVMGAICTPPPEKR